MKVLQRIAGKTLMDRERSEDIRRTSKVKASINGREKINGTNALTGWQNNESPTQQQANHNR